MKILGAVADLAFVDEARSVLPGAVDGIGRIARDEERLSRLLSALPEANRGRTFVDAGRAEAGTHGRSGFAQLALGSVAERFVRRAGRPVLVIRP